MAWMSGRSCSPTTTRAGRGDLAQAAGGRRVGLLQVGLAVGVGDQQHPGDPPAHLGVDRLGVAVHADHPGVDLDPGRLLGGRRARARPRSGPTARTGPAPGTGGRPGPTRPGPGPGPARGRPGRGRPRPGPPARQPTTTARSTPRWSSRSRRVAHRATGPVGRRGLAEPGQVGPDHRPAGLGERPHLVVPHPPVGDAGVHQQQRRPPPGRPGRPRPGDLVGQDRHRAAGALVAADAGLAQVADLAQGHRQHGDVERLRLLEVGQDGVGPLDRRAVLLHPGVDQRLGVLSSVPSSVPGLSTSVVSSRCSE